ncbi:ABC transporter ATP-binding protein [Roseomonas sp. NAR14]|uniref:ABC transporter ATP-binding protein n=1 Tax=Roseomonas acroporae TaxID=2937791 RepID=A0A9X1Y8T0_9PROT|nr:ABC transporter ATP-binding protein [Roseomonas acroporae]MCK8784385.1 ABC transporter ATP-binding protein [Roseomonas acroporae]
MPAADTLTLEAPAAPARAARPMLRLDGVSKRYGALTVLHEAWLKVERGEFVTLLGPSGCGKTTLLNLVAGFARADGGEVLLDGEPITDRPVWERDIGMMFQSYALFPHMSVARNVGYGLRCRGLRGRAEAARVEESLSLVKLAHLAARRPAQLSGGQQQRVALARALAPRPRLLLLDEPFSALDRNLRIAMQTELKEIQRRLGVTTVFVTHDQDEALSMSDRIAVMSEGRILQYDTPEAIYRRPADRFVAGFVGDAAVLRGRLLRRGGASAVVQVGEAALPVPSAPLDGVAEGAAVEVFIRPECLAPAREGPALLEGRIAARAYMGDRTELQIETPLAPSGRILLRVAGGGFAVGERLAVALVPAADGAMPSAFPAA